MKRLFVVFVITFVLLGCGFSSSNIYFTPGKFENNKDVIIYIYRNVEILGAITWEIYLDDKLVGKLPRNSYFDIHTTPGRHELLFNNAGLKFKMAIDAEPNTFLVISLSTGKPEVVNENVAMSELIRKKYDKGL